MSAGCINAWWNTLLLLKRSDKGIPGAEARHQADGFDSKIVVFTTINKLFGMIYAPLIAVLSKGLSFDLTEVVGQMVGGNIDEPGTIGQIALRI